RSECRTRAPHRARDRSRRRRRRRPGSVSRGGSRADGPRGPRFPPQARLVGRLRTNARAIASHRSPRGGKAARSILRVVPVRPAVADVASTDEGLKRKLIPRQYAMMAIGGAIGVGLLLGSTVTIRLAGPGVIVTYVFGALIALVMCYALAEMAVVHPVAGSFGVFADRYLS